MLAFTILTMKVLVTVMEYNIHNDAIRRRILTSIKVIVCILMPTLTIFKMLTFDMLVMTI